MGRTSAGNGVGDVSRPGGVDMAMHRPTGPDRRLPSRMPVPGWGPGLRPGGEYGVYGNTMAPGFVPSDFEGAAAADLIAHWPHRAELIAALTR
jgi:uncharacterized protein